MAMFHWTGVTPEAPTAEAAFGGNLPSSSITVTDRDIEAILDSYRYRDGSTIVVFSAPQLSLYEMQDLARLFDGRHVADGMTAVATTSPMIHAEAARLGYVAILEQAGVRIMQGVCFYILQRLSGIREQNGWTNLVSNSGKLVNTITAHRFNTVLRRTRDCVEIACTGRLV